MSGGYWPELVVWCDLKHASTRLNGLRNTDQDTPMTYRILNWIARYTNWNFVRAFGELTILTRASLSMLFFVPVLAALWPTVRWGINGYNEFLVLRNRGLDAASGGSENTQVTLPENLLNEIPQLPTDLPDIWAIAFLASLCSVLGSVIYQTRAPSLIKDYKLAEFEEVELKRYRENPTETQLNNARRMIDGQKTLDTSTGEWEPSFDLEERWEQLHGSSNGYSSDDVEMLAREYISLGAREQYGAFAYSGLLSSTFAAFCYMVALVSIIWIIISQTTAVFHQAGWL